MRNSNSYLPLNPIGKQTMYLGHVFPTRRRKGTKLVEGVVGICVVVILMRCRTLEEETEIEHVPGS